MKQSFILRSRYIFKIINSANAAREKCILLAKSNRDGSQAYAVLGEKCTHFEKDCFECLFTS